MCASKVHRCALGVTINYLDDFGFFEAVLVFKMKNHIFLNWLYVVLKRPELQKWFVNSTHTRLYVAYFGGITKGNL